MFDGTIVGNDALGFTVGCDIVGKIVGPLDGKDVSGLIVGNGLGICDGLVEGICVRSEVTGNFVGCSVGMELDGTVDGENEGKFTDSDCKKDEVLKQM